MNQKYHAQPEHRSTAIQASFLSFPASFLEGFTAVQSLAELKVILYILKHTAGSRGMLRERAITLDEFTFGCRGWHGRRLDQGAGLCRSAVIDGIKRAVEDGFVIERIDRRDLARIRKWYLLAFDRWQTASSSLTAAQRTTLKTLPGKKAPQDQTTRDPALPLRRIPLAAFYQRLEQRRPFLQKAPAVKFGWQGWKALRTFIFKVDDFTCQYCGQRGGLLECDHILPRSRGGSDSPTNLVTACGPCNRAKGDQTPEEWLRSERGEQPWP